MAGTVSFTDEQLLDALEQCHGQVTAAARLLGKTAPALWYRIRTRGYWNKVRDMRDKFDLFHVSQIVDEYHSDSDKMAAIAREHAQQIVRADRQRAHRRVQGDRQRASNERIAQIKANEPAMEVFDWNEVRNKHKRQESKDDRSNDAS